MPPRTSVTDPPAPEELGNLQNGRKKGESEHREGVTRPESDETLS